MTVTRAEAFAPATVANLGVGFDILGLALCEPGDVVRAELRDEPGAVVIHIEGDGGKLSKAADKNTQQTKIPPQSPQTACSGSWDPPLAST